MTHRLAAWANQRLLPAVLGVLLLMDLGVGLNWLLSPPSSLTSPVYDTAKRVMSMHGFGALFAALAVTTGVLVLERWRGWLSGRLVAVGFGGLWLFWAVLFTLVPLGRPGSSYFGAVVACALALLHLLAGLALTRPPVEGD